MWPSKFLGPARLQCFNANRVACFPKVRSHVGSADGSDIATYFRLSLGIRHVAPVSLIVQLIKD